MFSFFFFNDTATTEIYTYLHTLSLHDALPISTSTSGSTPAPGISWPRSPARASAEIPRSEEHTSELQSLMRSSYAVFCLKKKKRAEEQGKPTTVTKEDRTQKTNSIHARDQGAAQRQYNDAKKKENRKQR